MQHLHLVMKELRPNEEFKNRLLCPALNYFPAVKQVSLFLCSLTIMNIYPHCVVVLNGVFDNYGDVCTFHALSVINGRQDVKCLPL